MTNANEKLAKLVQILAKRLWPHPTRAASVHVECIDGKELDIPVYIGSSSQTQNACESQQDRAGNKKKILAAAPEKHEPPISKQKLFSKAKLSVTNWNNDKLWELVEEGELVHLKLGFRKAK
jgi:hypothetical protein